MASLFSSVKQQISHLSAVYTQQLPFKVFTIPATEASYKERQLQSFSPNPQNPSVPDQVKASFMRYSDFVFTEHRLWYKQIALKVVIAYLASRIIERERDFDQRNPIETMSRQIGQT